jgi:hypothetical protein
MQHVSLSWAVEKGNDLRGANIATAEKVRTHKNSNFEILIEPMRIIIKF